ncbi:MAG: chitosanase [Rhodobacteraceae bacterium]|nr:chitosanase [Paracoccaceae bacterium]
MKKLRSSLAALLAATLLLSQAATLAHAQDTDAADDAGEQQTDDASDADADQQAVQPDAIELVQADTSADAQAAFEDKLVSVFENGTPEIQYGYIENLDDGRGFTAGRAGFTTGTGDLLEVVEKYSQTTPGNALEGYLDALRAVNGTDSVAGLDGLAEAWAQSATDPAFVAAQDAINDKLYREPARQLASEIGAELALTKAAIYEAGIQHGYGDDPDAVNSIAARATAAVGGTPASGVDEKVWLGAFLEERRQDLLAPKNAETAEVWKESVGRADAMIEIYKSGNLDLSKPVEISVFGGKFNL